MFVFARARKASIIFGVLIRTKCRSHFIFLVVKRACRSKNSMVFAFWGTSKLKLHDVVFNLSISYPLGERDTKSRRRNRSKLVYGRLRGLYKSTKFTSVS